MYGLIDSYENFGCEQSNFYCQIGIYPYYVSNINTVQRENDILDYQYYHFLLTGYSPNVYDYSYSLLESNNCCLPFFCAAV